MKVSPLEELIRFAKEMGYENLGIAFRIGLSNEARMLSEVLEGNFRVTSVCCRVCGIDKERCYVSARIGKICGTLLETSEGRAPSLLPLT